MWSRVFAVLAGTMLLSLGVRWAGVVPAAPLDAIILLAFAGLALMGSSQLLVRLFLPYDWEPARWRGLARLLPQLDLTTFGGRAPTEAWLRRGRARVRIQARARGHRIRIHLSGLGPPAGITLRGRPAPGETPVHHGLAGLEHLFAYGPTPETVALLDDRVCALARAWVAGSDVTVRAGYAVFHHPSALARPAETLAYIDGLICLLEALEAVGRSAPEEVLARGISDPEARAVRLRILFEYYPLDADRLALARSLATSPCAPLRWAASGGLVTAQDRRDRARGVALLAEALTEGDEASRRHALGVVREDVDEAEGVELIREALLRAPDPVLPEEITFLADRDALPPFERWAHRVVAARPDGARAVLPALEQVGCELGLLALARHRSAEVALPAMAAIRRTGTLESVVALLALARASRTPARRGEALRVARALQAKHGIRARGALSCADGDAQSGRLSPSVASRP